MASLSNFISSGAQDEPNRDSLQHHRTFDKVPFSIADECDLNPHTKTLPVTDKPNPFGTALRQQPPVLDFIDQTTGAMELGVLFLLHTGEMCRLTFSLVMT